jgi:cathepsin L
MIDFKQSERREIFKSNLQYIIRHNADPSTTFKLKITEFSDWTDEERDGLRSKINFKSVNNKQPLKSRDVTTIPSEYDWTNQTRIANAVTPVKNQHHCGSCYAFGMVGVLEKTYAEIYNQSGPLSPQQFIDCRGPGGCDGGTVEDSFEYLRSNDYKLNLEKDYPTPSDGKQQEKCQKSGGVSLSYNSTYKLNYERLPAEDEENMKKILYERGPLVVYFNCGERTGNDTILREASNKFDHYASGIFDVPGCPAYRNLNHAPVIVGYGTDNGTDYWKVKNSWGPDWGENGYIRVKRNDNMCGIATSPFYVGLFP